MAESQVGTTELILPEGPWLGVQRLEIETLNWVRWFNHEQIHESVHDLPPPR